MKSIMLLRKNWETFSDTISYGKEGLHKKITLKKAFSKEGGKQILNYLSLKEWDTFFLRSLTLFVFCLTFPFLFLFLYFLQHFILFYKVTCVCVVPLIRL